MATKETSAFPRFDDGDVSLVVDNKFYQLHSSVLRRHSSVFAALLDKAPGAKLTKKARDEKCTAYHLELFQDASMDVGGRFERREVSDSGRVSNNSFILPTFSHAIHNSSPRLKQWDWLFRIFYNLTPDFDDTDLETLIRDCVGLIDIAESVDCATQVHQVVDLALLRQDHVLWLSITGNPIAWAELGCRIRSPTIFTEAICHLVGRWKTIDSTSKLRLDSTISELCEKKYTALERAKEAIEMRILGHYPPQLTRLARDRPARAGFANDIYMWMALCFFRQWFAQAISENRTRQAADGGFAFYTDLSRGGQAYLHHEDFKQFHAYFPMSSKACNVLETNMGVLKEEVKRFVKDLVVSRVHDLGKGGKVEWLTCTVVDKEDLPWARAEDEDKEGSDGEEQDGDGDGAAVNPFDLDGEFFNPPRPGFRKRMKKTD